VGSEETYVNRKPRLSSQSWEQRRSLPNANVPSNVGESTNNEGTRENRIFLFVSVQSARPALYLMADPRTIDQNAEIDVPNPDIHIQHMYVFTATAECL
jgi:hypothetical protein